MRLEKSRMHYENEPFNQPELTGHDLYQACLAIFAEEEMR